MNAVPYRTVLLTNGSPHALRIAEGLRARQFTLDAIVYEAPALRSYLPRSGSTLAIARALPIGVARWTRASVRAFRASRVYAPFAERFLLTGPLNSDKMRGDLASLRPDFIVLGGTGILKRPTIELAAQGVLNAHPGLLPWVRGTGVVGRAIQMGIPVGCTCHYVNAGVDRGRIVERRLLYVDDATGSLAELEHRADLLAAEMMVDIVARLLESGEPPGAVEQSEKYPLSTWLTPAERLAVDEQVKRGRARELFELWRPATTGGERYALPPDFQFPGYAP
ncbi:MAG TPA: formyltransferase family protein [Chloroflexia bacterium]